MKIRISITGFDLPTVQRQLSVPTALRSSYKAKPPEVPCLGMYGCYRVVAGLSGVVRSQEGQTGILGKKKSFWISFLTQKQSRNLVQKLSFNTLVTY